MQRRYPPTHRPLSHSAQAQLQTLHEGLSLSILQFRLQTSPYTLARAKAGAPMLMSDASALEQRITGLFQQRAVA